MKTMKKKKQEAKKILRKYPLTFAVKLKFYVIIDHVDGSVESGKGISDFWMRNEMKFPSNFFLSL